MLRWSTFYSTRRLYISIMSLFSIISFSPPLSLSLSFSKFLIFSLSFHLFLPARLSMWRWSTFYSTRRLYISIYISFLYFSLLLYLLSLSFSKFLIFSLSFHLFLPARLQCEDGLLSILPGDSM